MFLLDDRIGARDLQTPLERLGVEVEPVRLDYGDCAWLGHGEAGPDTMQVGCELKTISDLLDLDRLSGHQLPGLLRQYDRVWLIVEGLYRPGTDGVLEVWINAATGWQPLRRGTRGYTYREVDHLLATLELRAGLYVRRSTTRIETAHIVAALYTWWRGKAWDEHRAHLRLARGMDVALLTPPPLRRLVANQLPGIGHAKSAAVAAHFPSTRALVLADRAEWARVDGIGPTIAARITEALATQ